jgi:hypothetical protein
MGFIGDVFGGGKSSAEKAAERAAEILEAVDLPGLREVAIERLAEVGDPRDFIDRMKDTELAKLKADPKLREAQLGALQKISDITAGQGLSEEDRAQIREIGKEEAIREKGQREAISQTAEQRGVGGSGFELAQQLAAEQGGAERAASRDVDVAQMAQSRALDAIREQARLGGEIRGQDFGEASQVATAQDIINQFNTQERNRAGQAAFINRQSIANQNVELENIQREQANKLAQQRFENELRRGQAISGAREAAIAPAEARGARTAGTVGSILSTGGELLSGGSLGQIFKGGG